MQEMSDTESIDHDHHTQTTEVSDTETIDHEPTDLEEPRFACERVLELTELLEHIISFLPMKKIFTIQRVSKRWSDAIASSPSIQEKMFLRLKTTPKETCEAHKLGWPKSTGALQRLAPPALTLVSLNPELQHDPICKDRRYGLTCPGHGRRVMVQWGPVPIKQCHSLFDTYISDPPCKYAEISLTVRFRKQELRSTVQDSDAEYPIKLWASYITASSDSGLTFQDVLRAGLNARGQTECKDDFNFPSKFEHHIADDIFRYRTFSGARDLSLREVVGLLPDYTKIPEVLDCVLMELEMTLLDDIAAPTLQERAELLRRGITPT
jgi:hypothetical protein